MFCPSLCISVSVDMSDVPTCFPAASDEPAGFFERLVATILKNVQVFVTNVHVRYEDTISTPECPLAAGVCIQSISAETTNRSVLLPPTGPCLDRLLVRLKATDWFVCRPPTGPP